jgi:UPF0755 protein
MSWLPRSFFRGIWMPRGNRRRAAALAGVVLLAALLFALACVPAGSERSTVGLIVKRGTKIGDVAHALKEEGLIRSEYLFLLWSSLLFRGRVVAGEYELSPHLSIVQIARKMANGERRVYTLRIVEGNNIYTVSDVIQKAGIMDAPSFLELATGQEFLKKMGIDAVSVEGYLFPDTYFFSKETEVDEFLGKIVRRTFKLFDQEDMQQQMQRLHMTMADVLSLASIIEKEAKLENEKRLISAVFHNRLRLGMTLDADPTVIYGQARFHQDIRKSDLLADNPYNTYRRKGLPRGPICNPSKGSISAALYPEQTDFLYFVSRNDGSHVFSASIEEHNHYVMLYQRNKNRSRGSEETRKRKSGSDRRPLLRHARVVASS